MNRIDRLTGIILALQGGKKTATTLAERFEVSRRTILRDVDALSQIGVPVVALPGPGGGYTLAEGYHLPPLNLSPAEATVVLLGLRALGGPETSPFGTARQTIEEKLRVALGPAVLGASELSLNAFEIRPPSVAAQGEHVTCLRGAIEDGRWVRLRYASARREASHDCLPLLLVAEAGRWYCRAISLEAEAERSYRLDRIASVSVIPTPAGAERACQAATRPRRSYDHAAHPEIVVRLSYAGVRQAEDIIDTKGRLRAVDVQTWELRFRCPPGELDYYAHAFFAMASDALVLEPPAVRATIATLARATIDHYDGTQ